MHTCTLPDVMKPDRTFRFVHCRGRGIACSGNSDKRNLGTNWRTALTKPGAPVVDLVGSAINQPALVPYSGHPGSISPAFGAKRGRWLCGNLDTAPGTRPADSAQHCRPSRGLDTPSRRVTRCLNTQHIHPSIYRSTALVVAPPARRRGAAAAR